MLIAAGLLSMAVAARAQLGLPGAGGVIDGVRSGVGQVADTLDPERLEGVASNLGRSARNLLDARRLRLDRLVRDHGDAVVRDPDGNPAVRGVVILTGASDEAVDALRRIGYPVEAERIDGLDIGFARVSIPEGETLAEAIRRLRKLVPGASVSADPLYFPSGHAPAPAGAGLAGGGDADGAEPIGLIDGGVARHPSLTGPVTQRGFAKGAPVASGHGTAVASLLTGTGPVKGAAPGVPLLVADVYGADPAGGSAIAIARALGWMAVANARVVTISLVGPANPLLLGALQAARRRGLSIVAAVGNDGPAAPPAYPASYPGIIAVTGVDGRDKVLVEAGKALHVDFAAPGAEMMAASADGRAVRVRGTSFAAPLVAGRLYRHLPGNTPDAALRALAGEAKDLGRKGMDPVYGRGLICADCRNNH